MRSETKSMYRKIASMVASGKSIRATATHYGISPAMVNRACNEFGDMRPTKPWKIAAAIINGDVAYETIAANHGVTLRNVQGVAARLRAAGWRDPATQPVVIHSCIDTIEGMLC